MENSLEQKHSRAISPWFNVICICITVAIVSVLIYKRMHCFRSEDIPAELVVLTPQELHTYRLTQTLVNVGLHIKNMPEFNVKKGYFSIDAIVWFDFDPRVISVSRIGKFSFENGIIQKKVKLGSQMQPNGNLLVYYGVNANFNIQLNFESFPFDNHTINFILTNEYFSPEEIAFKASRNNLTTASHFEVEEWQYVDNNVRTGYIKTTLNPPDAQAKIYDPRAIFSLSFERVGMRYIISILLPLMILFFIALFSFTFNPDKEPKTDIVSLVVALVTGIIAYRFTIENLSPEVGYFMISDYLFLFLLSAISLVLVTNVFIENTTAKQKKLITLLLHLAVIALFFYILNPWS